MSSIVERLTAWFSGSDRSDAPLPELDAAHAIGALLVRVAKADHVYLFEELEQIDRILAQRNGMNPVDAAKMRAECERLEAAIPDTPRFSERIRDGVSYDERHEVVRALWKVVLADGIREEHEVALVDLIQEQLGISAAHSTEAREAAEAIP